MNDITNMTGHIYSLFEQTFIITAAQFFLIFLVLFLLLIIFKLNRAINIKNITIKDMSTNLEILENSNKNLEAENSKLNNNLTNEHNNMDKYIYYDPLTHLPNINRLKSDLRKIQAKSIIDGALILIDVDNFRHINNRFGHTFGDEALKEIATHLQMELTEYATLYRLGGDEFIVLLESATTIDTIDYIANKLSEHFKAPITVDKHSFPLTLSLGIAIISMHGNSFDELMRHVELALLNSKNTGKNKLSYYDESIEKNIENIITLQQNFYDALFNKKISFTYNPIYNITSKRIQMVELEFSWQSPAGNFKTDAVVNWARELSIDSVLHQTLFDEILDFSNVLSLSDTPIYIVIPLTLNNTRDILMLDLFAKALENNPLENNLFCLEISACRNSIFSLNQSEIQNLGAQIQILKKLGILISIKVKAEADFDEKCIEILSSDFIKLEYFKNFNYFYKALEKAKYLGKTIAACGINDSDSKASIENLGIELVQGELYGVSMDRDQIINLVLDENVKIYRLSR